MTWQDKLYGAAYALAGAADVVAALKPASGVSWDMAAVAVVMMLASVADDLYWRGRAIADHYAPSWVTR